MNKFFIRKLFLFCVSLFGLFTIIKGQSTMISKVIDKENNVISGALVMILDEQENLFSSQITDSVGVINITMPANLTYHWFYITCYGYISQRWTLTDAAQQQTFILEANIQNLDAVMVTASRPNIVREMDKFVIPQIYNSSLAKGKNIIEFLGYAPLLWVNLDGYLEVLGKGKASIYVNGRKSNIDLQTLPAENIEKVEIIPFPGSLYPATEHNGIVNIVLHKPPEDGVLANMTIRDSQRERWLLNSPSLRLFLNIQKKKINITTGISTSFYPYTSDEFGVYKYYSDSLDVYNNINNYSAHCNLNGYVHLDYHINNKHTLGFRIGSNVSYRIEKNTVETDYRFLNSTIVDSTNFTSSKLKMTTPNYSVHGNLNYNISFNTKQKLSFDWDYNHSLTDVPYYYQITKSKNNAKLFSDFRSQSTAKLDGNNFAVRFQHQFNTDMQLNVGAECYGAVVNNNFFYGNKINDYYVSDSLQSNRFLFKDITGAAYINFDWEISDEWSLSAGLRGEYYAYKGTQHTTGEFVSNKYPNVFPAFSIYYVPHDDHELGINFTTNYFLPGYSMLNPFRTYYSPNLYRENNPNIKPVKEYNLAFEYIFFSDYMLTFEYEFSKNSFTEFRIPVGNGITKITTMNYGKDHNFWFSFSITKNLLKNFLYLSLNTDLSYYIAKDIPNEIVAYNESGFAFILDIKANTALCKKKDWRFETRFQYSPKRALIAYTLSSNFYLAASISKNFKNCTLSFGVDDIIDMPIKISQYAETYAYNYERYKYGRTYWLSFNIKFGNIKVGGTQNRNKDNIQQRMQ